MLNAYSMSASSLLLAAGSSLHSAMDLRSRAKPSGDAHSLLMSDQDFVIELLAPKSYECSGTRSDINVFLPVRTIEIEPQLSAVAGGPALVEI